LSVNSSEIYGKFRVFRPKKIKKINFSLYWWPHYSNNWRGNHNWVRPVRRKYVMSFDHKELKYCLFYLFIFYF
jgi:hypothetical protein